MNDEDPKPYNMTVEKSIEKIRFLVEVLEAKNPGRYHIPNQPFREGYLAVVFNKCGAVTSFNRIRGVIDIVGPVIRFQQIGLHGCKAQLVCNSKELDMIQDDFIVLRDALGLEGWQDDHAEKPSGKRKSNRGRKPNLKIVEQERLCKLYDSVKEDTTIAEFCKTHGLEPKTFEGYRKKCKERHNISE